MFIQGYPSLEASHDQVHIHQFLWECHINAIISPCHHGRCSVGTLNSSQPYQLVVLSSCGLTVRPWTRSGSRYIHISLSPKVFASLSLRDVVWPRSYIHSNVDSFHASAPHIHDKSTNMRWSLMDNPSRHPRWKYQEPVIQCSLDMAKNKT